MASARHANGRPQDLLLPGAMTSWRHSSTRCGARIGLAPGTGLDADAAERAARATLTTLAERLSPGEARDLLEELPAEMKPWVYTESAAERFDTDEFLRRVAERAGVDVETAERHARAVFFALGRAVRADEIDDIAAELPQDFEPLIAEARHRFFTVMPGEEFLSRVAERTGLDIDGARRAPRPS